jgi:myosin-5
MCAVCWGTCANDIIGLQTPRLKRLAEIVSQQAIAQQEKMEFDGPSPNENENGSNGFHNGHEAIQEEVGA